MSDRIAVMNQGRIEQLGPPTEIYEQPRSAFVAEFIGTSNFLRGHLAASENGLARVALPDGTEILARADGDRPPGEEALVMIRPEHLTLKPSEADALTLTASIKEVVYLGSFIRYLAEVASGDVLTVEEPNLPGAARARVGDPVALHVSPRYCLLLNETN